MIKVPINKNKIKSKKKLMTDANCRGSSTTTVSFFFPDLEGYLCFWEFLRVFSHLKQK
jgi:hypothetical protein